MRFSDSLLLFERNKPLRSVGTRCYFKRYSVQRHTSSSPCLMSLGVTSMATDDGMGTRGGVIHRYFVKYMDSLLLCEVRGLAASCNVK